MVKCDKRKHREVRYTGKRACETLDRTFYDAIKIDKRYNERETGMDNKIIKENKNMKAVQRLLVFQQNGSGEQKIAGVKKYGGDLFHLEVISIDESLPLVLDDTSDYIPADISCDLVLDFLTHDDLSQDLVALCAEKEIPVISSGKKIISKWVATPPT
jgi:hypothetical protein